MKEKPGRSFWIKLALAVGVFLIAPFAAPMLLEMILLVDILGLEALILYMLYQARHQFALLRHSLQHFLQPRARTWLMAFTAMLLVLGNLYMLQPDVAVAHLFGSFLLLAVAGSAALAIMLWLPPLLLSHHRHRPEWEFALPTPSSSTR